MNGFADLLKEGQGAAPAQQEGAPEQPKGFSTAQGKQAPPELQAQYDRFVGMCMKLLWGETFLPKVVQMFKKHPNQTDAMASIGAGIAQRIYMEAKKNGHEIPPEILVHGGWEVMQEIATLAQAAGIEGIEPDEIETAYYLAADKVGEALNQAGLIDHKMVEEQSKQVRQMAGDELIGNVQQRVGGAQQKTMDAMMQQRQAGGQQT
ncbi:hypothetical protein PXK30_09515 [Phaeobacter gallaeciensis]|uniref:hypothetical protein n=1 Tax=Phaeobacter gallaeciensis TaxID=60890 RepID=UPI00237FC9AB|nr:hypothetical protein [Phaeobacter gallaeciensis]MDE4303640.1 hypothetical protein [Phaeobacter gallaeciensis]MDE4307878.1 hypothetical protein [Phaeobacter gallaeciensis]MDE4312336.1 hypothetical protein [Phaeobacter gallaeciensis]MDE4316807.1 hypothetical protein [Phaeobacter gallaeciensis]MDE4321270.1 hypothetical protein [Phaeobacter gallaeciensis]